MRFRFLAQSHAAAAIYAGKATAWDLANEDGIT